MAAALAEGSGVTIRARRLAHWHELPGVEAEWEGLLSRARGSVFQTLPWQLAWWEAFGAGHELVAVVARQDGRLVGIAPMMIAPAAGGRTRELQFIGSDNHASDYCDLVVDPAHPEAVDALLDCACAAAGAVGRVSLTHLPSGSANRPRMLEFFARRGYAVRAGTDMVAPARRLGDTAADRRAANKKSLKRHTRLLRDAGDVRFLRVTDAAEADGHLDAFFELHVARWAGTPTPSQFLDPAQRRFYRALVRHFVPAGQLRFDLVLLDGRPVAAHFGFERDRRFTWYKTAHDVRLAVQAPGEVLLKHLLDRAIDDGLAEFDFTVGAEGYKFRFANVVREVGHVVGYASAADCWRDRTVAAARRAWRRFRGRDVAAARALAAAQGITSGDGAP